jgi:hypothetical protein
MGAAWVLRSAAVALRDVQQVVADRDARKLGVIVAVVVGDPGDERRSRATDVEQIERPMSADREAALHQDGGLNGTVGP